MYKFIIPTALAFVTLTACTPSEVPQDQPTSDSTITDSSVIVVDTISADTTLVDSVK